MSGNIRAFAAIPVPEDVADILEDLQEDLPAGNPVPGENMHLTLAFLGEVRQPDLEEVHLAFERLRAPPFEVALTGLGQFGGSAPRAVYAAVEDDPALRHLQAKVEQAARGAGIDLPRRRFVPHVTLARLKGRRDEAAAVATFTTRRATISVPPFEADAFCLFRSLLRRDGPVYDELARYPLSP